MNITTIAICFLAYKLLKPSVNSNNNSSARLDSNSLIDSMLSQEAKDIMGNLNTLADKDSDKTGVLLSMLSNPSVMSLVSSMFGGAMDNLFNFGSGKASNTDNATHTAEQQDNSQDNSHSSDNSQYDTTPYYGGSDNSHQFFSQVDDVAGREVSSKLYHIYDNWYGSTT